MATYVDGPSAPRGTLPWLLRLYPGAWRERYGVELVDLLTARPPTLRDRLDIVGGAIDARLHPQVVEAPAPRVVTVGDRVIALAAMAVGGLFSAWAGIIVVGSPRWGEAGTVGNDLLAMSYPAGAFGAIIATGVLLGVACRHIDDFRLIGMLGAVVAAAGFLAITGDSGATAIPLIVLGTIGMTPGLVRAVGRPVAGFALGATLFLALAMYGFVGSDGQELLWLWMLAGYGPSWMLLGLALRRGPRVAPPPLVGA